MYRLEISYEEALRKIHHNSVAYLLKNSKYELYKKAFRGDLGVIEGLTQNDFLHAANTLMAIDVIKKGSPEDLSVESRKIYDDYIQNNGQYNNIEKK